MRERKLLMEKISNLGCTEHQEIYKILHEGGINYSENNNGIFFNLTTVAAEVLDKIEAFVAYCYENKSELDEYDKKLNECKYLNNINNIVKPNTFHSGINEPIDSKERFKEMFETVDKTAVVRDFIDKINTNIEKVSHKRAGTKYAMAKKKYMKRATVDFEVQDDLEQEDYLS